MDYELSQEQKMIRDMSHQCVKEVIAPKAEEADRTGHYAYDIIDKMAALGMMGIPFPEKYGGGGLAGQRNE